MTTTQAPSIEITASLDKAVKHSKRYAGTVRVGTTPVELAPYIPNEILAALGIGAGDRVVITLRKA